MSKIRSIKPDWLDDELLVECGSDARVLSVALILMADDHGNGRAGRLQLAARVFPGSPIDKAEEALAALVRMRYVRLYDIDGQRYFSIRSWDKHQRLDKRATSAIPAPPEIDSGIGGLPISGKAPEDPGDTWVSQDLSGLACIPSTPDSKSSPPLKLISDRPEGSGSAPASGRARSKPPAKSEHVPFTMHDGWMPNTERVAAMAVKYDVPPDAILALVAEFRVYWKQQGKRVGARYWEQTFASRVDAEAKRGNLFLLRRGAPGGASRVSLTPEQAAAKAKREAEFRERQKADLAEEAARITGSLFRG